MSAKFIAVYPVVTQHPWTSVDIRNEVVGSIPTLASKISEPLPGQEFFLNGKGMTLRSRRGDF
jgi:hypothetical protein